MGYTETEYVAHKGSPAHPRECDESVKKRLKVQYVGFFATMGR